MASPLFLCFLMVSGALAVNLSHVNGVAGAGWLHLEDWMFSWPSPDSLPSTSYSYDLVDTQRGEYIHPARLTWLW